MPPRYGHFCLAARTLETVGERWSLLIVRDLMNGPRRFGDLRRLLTNVTAKWLTIRLRHLEVEGIVTRTQPADRREVWYELTDKGRDLAPLLDALVLWGLKHERRPLAADEVAHPEHLIAGLVVALNEIAPRPSGRRLWRVDFGEPEGSFGLAFDGERWSRVAEARRPDVVVRTTARDWADFIAQPPGARRIAGGGIELEGEPERVDELLRVFRAPKATPGRRGGLRAT
jgi:DNA-binding HxlR family transcriptional regulator